MDALTLVTADNSILDYRSNGGDFKQLPFIGDISLTGGERPETEVMTLDSVGKVVGKKRIQSLSVEIPSYVPTLPAWKDLKAAYDDETPLTFRITTEEKPRYASTGAGNTVAIATDGKVSFVGEAPDFLSGLIGMGMALSLPATAGEVVANTATVEYVYLRQASSAAPTTPLGGAGTDDFVPTGWSATPLAPTADGPYVFRSTRTQDSGAWAALSFALPSLWALGAMKFTIDTISDTGEVEVAPHPGIAVGATALYEISMGSLRLGPFLAEVLSGGNFELPAEGNLSSTLNLGLLAPLGDWEIV